MNEERIKFARRPQHLIYRMRNREGLLDEANDDQKAAFKLLQRMIPPFALLKNLYVLDTAGRLSALTDIYAIIEAAADNSNLRSDIQVYLGGL